MGSQSQQQGRGRYLAFLLGWAERQPLQDPLAAVVDERVRHQEIPTYGEPMPTYGEETSTYGEETSTYGAEVVLALPDYAAPASAVLTTESDIDGARYVIEDDPAGDPQVDPNYDAQDRNWVRYRSHWGGFLRLVGAVVILAVLFSAIRGRIYDWIDQQIIPAGAIGEPVMFTIGSGESVNQIATNLDNADVISNATVFRYWLRCDGPNGGAITISGFLQCDQETSFEAGEYALFENMPYTEANDILELGPIPEVYQSFTFPEGLRVAEIIERMLQLNPQYQRTQIIATLNNPDYRSKFLPEDVAQFSWYEGLLFPATYDVAESDLRDEARLIQKMSNTFDERFSALLEEVGRDPVIDSLGLTDYQVITLASLIEEEARVAVDRPKMARVMYNRLLSGVQLGVDASVYYALSKSFEEGLTAADLSVDSPYNTRLNPGIPPTPIAAPGEAALRAALQPDPDPDLLYWVRTDHGGINGAHTFTTNLDDHNAAVAICRDLGYCS